MLIPATFKVPIALKRSQMENGRSVRRGAFIDIPLVYDMPHFAKDSSLPEDDPLHGHFVLVLQSFLCHQGTRTDSGHYISAARCPSSQDGPDQWLLMDDLAKERISYIDDIRKFLDKEKPYLLFYRVEPIGSDPPPYRESADQDSGVAGLSETRSQSSDSKGEEAVIISRHSLDSSLPENRRGRPSMSSDRRQSSSASKGIAEGTKANPTTFLSADAEQNSSSVSRRGSKVSKTSSTVSGSSQSKDKRSSISLSRLAGKLSKEKSNTSLPGPDSNGVQQGTTSRPPTSDGSKAFEIGKPADKKSNPPSSGHRHGVLGKQRVEKPERECILM